MLTTLLTTALTGLLVAPARRAAGLDNALGAAASPNATHLASACPLRPPQQAALIMSVPAEEAAARRSSAAPAMKLRSLYRYPVKSGRAEPLAAATLFADGIAGDREFAVTLGGVCQTQRQQGALATLGAHLDGETLRLEAGGRAINVSTRAVSPTLRAKIFADEIDVVDQGDPVGRWLGGVLGGPVGQVLPLLGLPAHRLVRAARSPGRHAGLKDASPIHLICESSLAELNGRRASAALPPVGIERFRPNLVVSGCAAPFVEDSWTRVTIGGASFRVDGPCPRCTVPDVQQNSGARDAANRGPMHSLGYRRARGGTMFGIYLTPTTVGAVVRVGEDLVAA